jgi:DNA-binding CsgD family transcriptional regulator
VSDAEIMAENYKRAFRYGLKRGMDEDKAYDFAGWIVEKFPRERVEYLKFHFIAYFRKTVGSKRSPFYESQRALNAGFGTGGKSGESENASFPEQVCARRDLERYHDAGELDRHLGRLDPKQKLIFFMVSEGYSNREIAKLFGLSGARIGQIITPITGQLKLIQKNEAIEEMKSQCKWESWDVEWFSL